MKWMTVRLARAVRFPAGANVAQAFGHDAQAWAKYQCQPHARFSRRRRMIYADSACMILFNRLDYKIFKEYPIRIKTLLWATRVLTLAPIASLPASTTVQTSQTES
jgi:hypothetical protein